MDTQREVQRGPKGGINQTTLHGRVRQIIKMAIRIQVTKNRKMLFNILNFTRKPANGTPWSASYLSQGKSSFRTQEWRKSTRGDVGQGFTGDSV